MKLVGSGDPAAGPEFSKRAWLRLSSVCCDSAGTCTAAWHSGTADVSVVLQPLLSPALAVVSGAAVQAVGGVGFCPTGIFGGCSSSLHRSLP